MEQNRNKTFVFEKEDTQQSNVMEYEVDRLPLHVDLNTILQANCPMALNCISIYDPDT